MRYSLNDPIKTPVQRNRPNHSSFFTISFRTAVMALLSLLIGGLFIWGKFEAGEIHSRGSQENPQNPKNESTSSLGGVSGDFSPMTGWKTFEAKEYKLSIKYPSDWILTDKATDPSLPYTYERMVNLISARLIGRQPYQEQETIITTIAIFDRPSGVPITEWLSKGFNINLLALETGGSQDVLTMAYSDQKGILSFSRSIQENISIYNLRGVQGGILSYMSFIVATDGKYVFLVEIAIPFNKEAVPNDSFYLEVFNQIVSSLSFTY